MLQTTLPFIKRLNKTESAIFAFFNIFVPFKGAIFSQKLFYHQLVVLSAMYFIMWCSLLELAHLKQFENRILLKPVFSEA